MERKQKIGTAISLVVLYTLLAKITGFAREIVLSHFFGASGISDAYLISQNIPGTIFQFVGTGLMTCFIPVYYKVLTNNDDTNQYTNRILGLVFLFSTVVIVVVWLFTTNIVKIFASGFDGNTLYYAVWFTRIGILSLYFSSMIYVFNSYLNANNIFSATAFAAIPNSIVIILSMVCGAKINIWLLSIGSTLAVGVQLAFLLPSIKKLNYRFKPTLSFNDEYIRLFFSLMLPVIFGVSVNEINVLVDRTVASQVAIGGISALTYAHSLIVFVQGGFVQPVATVFYPKITKEIAENQIERSKSNLSYAIDLVLGILIPVSVGFIEFSREIVEILFGHGAFDEKAIDLTSTAVTFYAVGICFVGLREFITRYYYANQDTKTPMINSSIGVGINIILNIILSKRIGISGLAIATSISAITTFSLLLYNSKKLCGGRIVINLTEIGKICISTVVMCIGSLFFFHLLSCNSAIRLILSIGIGIVVYYCIGKLLRIKIQIEARKMIVKVLGKIKSVLGM